MTNAIPTVTLNNGIRMPILVDDAAFTLREISDLKDAEPE